MKITPIEIKQHSFKTKMRGYCQDEVHAFLEIVSNEFDNQKNEIKELNQRRKDLEDEVVKANNSSREFDKVTVAINSIKDDLIKNSEKEASLAIEEAKIKATRMIQAAERKITSLQVEIQVLENKKEMVKENTVLFLQNQLSSLENLNSSFVESAIEEESPEKDEMLTENPETNNVNIIETELVLPQEMVVKTSIPNELEIEPLAEAK